MRQYQHEVNKLQVLNELIREKQDLSHIEESNNEESVYSQRSTKYLDIMSYLEQEDSTTVRHPVRDV